MILLAIQLAMRFSKKCQCCWHVVAAYSYTLNKSLVSCLIKLIEHGKPAKTVDLQLSKAQYWSFNKLQFRGFIEKNGDNLWIPTRHGKMFYEGGIVAYDTVAMLWKERLPMDHHARSTHKTKPKLVYIHDIVEVTYKQRKEYQQEKKRIVWVWKSNPLTTF